MRLMLALLEHIAVFFKEMVIKENRQRSVVRRSRSPRQYLSAPPAYRSVVAYRCGAYLLGFEVRGAKRAKSSAAIHRRHLMAAGLQAQARLGEGLAKEILK